MGFPIFIGLRRATMTEVAGQVRSYQRSWNDADHKGRPSVNLRVPVYVADTEEQALSEPQESFMTQFHRLGRAVASSADTPGADPHGDRAESGQQLASVTWEQVLDDRKVVGGTPETVAEQLHEMASELDLDGFAVEFNAGERIPREKVANSLTLFCERVVPSFN